MRAGQNVVGLDNFSTGKESNLGEVKSLVPPNQWEQFTFIEGDTGCRETVQAACGGMDYVLHLAALGSVLDSFHDPLNTNSNNVGGCLNVLVAARDQKVRRVVYASSNSVYGDTRELPNAEDGARRPLSPCAVSMAVSELYAQVFSRAYGLETVGLRYFNVFGPRQDGKGQDAPVIPRWIHAMIRNEPACINGDGATSRDFCYVANAVQATLLAAATPSKSAVGQVFNVALNHQTSLNQLFEIIRQKLLPDYPHLKYPRLVYQDFRRCDIRHSRADITKAQRILVYCPTHTLEQGLNETLSWYKNNRGFPSRLSQPDNFQPQNAVLPVYE